MAFSHFPRWLWRRRDSTVRPPPSQSMSPSSSKPRGAEGARPQPQGASNGENHQQNQNGGKGGAQRKRCSRTEQRVDGEFDGVLVPSDGVCMSGSDSDGSDWSIGWFERHSSEFSSDTESESSFAVLVPCYGFPSCREIVNSGQNPKTQLLDAVLSSSSSAVVRGFWLCRWPKACGAVACLSSKTLSNRFLSGPK